MSPITVQNVLPNNASTSDIKSVVRECFNEEFRNVVSDLKNDIKYQASHTTYQLRSMLLDVQMAMVKEFIKVENFNNRLRDDMLPNSNYEANLVEENDRLRKRIDFLEEQLKNLSDSKETGECLKIPNPPNTRYENSRLSQK
uniref:Uncharacterized protein LOC114334403 n=1 Tax=Diabrotica virgifera virgifera TaxID=50390 RepID=A0A6P7FV61_DIAVI